MTHGDEAARGRDDLDAYHRPGPVPRDEIWARIAERLEDHHGQTGPPGRMESSAEMPEVAEGGGATPAGGDDDLARARARRTASSRRTPARLGGWAVAAAAVLALGVGIGRMTAPAGPATTAEVELRPTGADATAPSGLTLATREHLDRSESLLTLVRADARDGRMDPAVGAWARGLLSQTRLILDRDGIAPETRDLLLDLELVLAQVARAAAEPADGAAEGTETSLTMRALEEGQLLSRLQVATPEPLAGT